MSLNIGRYHAELAIKRSMEVRREEFLDYMTFRENRRPLFTEIFGPLIGLKEEWVAQGASPEELDLSAYDFRRYQYGGIPVATGWLGGERESLVEETDDFILYRDRMGRRMQLFKKTATLPLPLDYPVSCMDDWLRIKSHYAFSEERFESGWEEIAQQHVEEGRVTCAWLPGGFDEPRQLMGEEGLCMAYFEEPELIHDMLTTIGDMVYEVLARVSSAVTVDVLLVHEDMAGKSGPLVGPNQVREFIKPYYRRVWDMLQENGARLFTQDSDGDMRPVLEAFVESGINVTYPCEPAAGMDVVKLREQYGTQLAFEGGIDKHVLRRSKDEIVAELEYKIPPMVASGGCVLGLDHRIPNGTPLENYRFYIEKAWEILNREGAKLGC